MLTAKNKICSIGVDIGGSKIAGVLFDGQKIIADYTLATPRDNFQHLLVMIKAVVDPLLETARKNKIKTVGVGLGVAGVVDPGKGRVLKSPNLPFLNNKEMAREVEKQIGLPVKMDNDANCFVRAEAKIGAGKGFKSVYGLTLGTGIGAAWWVNNAIHGGAHGAAGEAGHVIIDYENLIDLEKAFQRLMQNNAAQAAEEAYRGDRLAQKAYEEFGRYLGITLANLVNILDPDIFVIGGGAAKAGDLFLSEAKKIMPDLILSPAAKKIKVAPGKLGDPAGAIGAAMLIA